MIPTYIGKSDYCYSNSTSMLLATIGESVNPSLIEAIAGIGLSAFITNSNQLFISPLSTAPDIGISKALQILGFTYFEKATKKDEMPIDIISKCLPAVIGPLDMGYLLDNPDYENLHGADHYVLVYKIENGKVYFHDPAGFPSVSLPLDQIKPAWKAENILYKRGQYRFWAKPKRIKSPTEKEIYSDAIKYFSYIYKRNEIIAHKQKRLIGSNAILFTANRIKDQKENNEELMILKYFTLPISARRSLDLSDFVKEFNPLLSSLKREQSQLFGNAQGYTVSNDRKNLFNAFVEITKVEDEIRDIFLKLSV